jgi:type I restriction enzyme S subunit
MLFADVLEIKNGRNQRAVENPNGAYPIYGSGGAMGYADDFICQAHTVVIGRKGNINKPLFVDVPFWNVDTAFGLEAKRNVLLPKYLYYFCLRYDFEKLNKAVTIPSLTKADLLKIEIELPKLSIQEDIVSRLESIERVKLLRQYQLRTLDTLIKARFVEMFGNPVDNEKGWDVVSLEEACDGIGDGLHGTPEYDDTGEYPFINGNNLIDGTIVITPGTKFVNEETYKRHYIDISENAILISINGTLGKLAFYNKETVMLGKSACYCNLKPEMKREFVYAVMKSDSFAKFLEDNATASTIKNVGLKAMRGYKLIIPPDELQNEFISFARQVDKSKVIVQKALDEAQLLFDSLMQKYFG